MQDQHTTINRISTFPKQIRNYDRKTYCTQINYKLARIKCNKVIKIFYKEI